MSGAVVAFVLAAVLVTSAISGVLGMAGGSLLMGALVLTLPAQAALALHGAAQLASNASRAALGWRTVRYRTVGWFALGAFAAMGALAFVAFAPSKAAIFIALGLTPVLVWIPERLAPLDLARPVHAVAGGAAVIALALTAGVSGPLTELFLVRSAMSPRQIIATKAALQLFGHFAKVLFYGGAALGAAEAGGVPAWLFVAAAVTALSGAALGGLLLDRIPEASFRSWRRWIFTVLGGIYLVQGLRLLIG